MVSLANSQVTPLPAARAKNLNAPKWPKFGLSPLRALVRDELTKTGIDGIKFSDGSATLVAEVACSLARYAGQKAHQIPEEEQERACADLLKKKATVNPSTVIGQLVQNFSSVVPEFIASKCAEIQAAEKDAATARNKAATLVSRVRTVVRLFTEREWSNGISADAVVNPLSTHTDWNVVPAYAAWRTREEERLKRGTRSYATFVNLASQVHGFLEHIADKHSAAPHRETEAVAWGKLRKGDVRALPRNNKKPSLTELLCLNPETMVAEYNRVLTKKKPATQTIAKTAIRSFFLTVARGCPACFPPARLTALGIDPLIIPIPMITDWSRTLDTDPVSQKTMRTALKKFIRFVANDQRIDPVLEREKYRWERLKSRKAARVGTHEEFAGPTITEALITKLPSLAQHYSAVVRGDSKLTHQQKNSRLAALRRLCLYLNELGLTFITAQEIDAMRPERAPSQISGAPAHRNGKISKPKAARSEPSLRARARRVAPITPLATKPSPAKRPPTKTSPARSARKAAAPLKAETHALPLPDRKRDFTFASEKPHTQARNNRTLLLKQVDTIESIMREAARTLTLSDLATLTVDRYFPNRSLIQRGSLRVTLSAETNQKLTDYCQSMLNAPLGERWRKRDALLFPSEESGRELFALNCPSHERQILPRVMTAQLNLVGALLTCSVRPFSSKDSGASRPVTLRDLDSLQPFDYDQTKNCLYVRNRGSTVTMGVIDIPDSMRRRFADVIQHLRLSDAGASWQTSRDKASLFMSADGGPLLGSNSDY